MHSATSLKGSDANDLMGIISSAWTAEQHVIKHCNLETLHIPSAFATMCVHLVWPFCLWDFCGTNFFSGRGERSKVGSGLHEPAACQVKHLVDTFRDLLALLSRNFLLDAGQNNEVTQHNKINQLLSFEFKCISE